jgi:hypothetical protein
MKRLGIEDMRQRALERGGKCLSKEYRHRSVELKWRCKRGHVFNLRPRFLSRGAWCPECIPYDKKIASLALMQEWATRRGGKCLSKHYVDSETPVEWECRKGHRFKKTRDLVKQQKEWCRQCEIIDLQAKRLEKVKNIALKRNGKCVSDTYVNLDSPLEFVCKYKHRWKATPLTIIYSHSWCPYCYGKMRKTIGDMQQLAAKKKGKCISTQYINSITPLKWQCHKGHVWKTTPSIISAGSWCPLCFSLRQRHKRNS